MHKPTRILAATTLIASTVAMQTNVVEARCDGPNRPVATTFNRSLYIEEPARGTCDQNKTYSFKLRRVGVGCVTVFFEPVKDRADPTSFRLCKALEANYVVNDDDFGSQEWFSTLEGTSDPVWNSGY